MAQTNYQDMLHKLERRIPFRGNSCHSYIDCYGIYRVVSYTTHVASYDFDDKIWINPEKYSSTTSRLQNLIKRAWKI
jgi:hypothetical protein